MQTHFRILLLGSFCGASLMLAIFIQEPMFAQSTNLENQPVKNDEGDVVTQSQEPAGYFNLKTKTFGGQQFWTDVRHAGGWRIQVNSETGHHRLLDPHSVRQAWGNQLHCDQELDKKIVGGDAQLHSGKLVIVLHGLMRTNRSMQPLADFLHDQGDYETINFQYASSRNKVGEHAKALKGVIDQVGRQVTEINFVGHSLGNIVVRRYLHDTTDPQTGRQGDPRIHRIVMLGPPNQGSRTARLLKSSFLFQTIAGISGSQLARGWEKLEPTLAIPKFEFGIIAGGQESEDDFSNFILKGKDDFTVSVAETRLSGARDFMVRPLIHTTMMHQPEVLEAVLNFFQNGYFKSESDRKPILGNSANRQSVGSTR